eukprot:TRINITY_DN21003_c0_g1_i1.p1 TRINITY_DN21003_c0_g1~~TRINITY_DN21003_c0_g1_i1.p1  ORF type:complete len:324 (+),score=92.42 TRINITY_DN21003_c0_g1_i1:65-1036(+)
MMAVPLSNSLRVAFENYWHTDCDQTIGRQQMKAAIKRLDSSRSDAELDAFFETVDLNKNGKIEYEEFIDFVFSNDQVADLASQELGLLQLAVDGGEVRDDDAEIKRILDETSEAAEKQRREEARLQQAQEESIQEALRASAEETARVSEQREAQRREQQEEERMLLETSRREAQEAARRRAKAEADAEEAELEAALKASEKLAAEERERIKKRHEEEDSSELFQAALKASCLDLGPRGISQAAKVFASGDATIGQPKGNFDTSTSGARSKRAAAKQGAAPAFAGNEIAGKPSVAADVNSDGARKRQIESAGRTGGPAARVGLR